MEDLEKVLSELQQGSLPYRTRLTERVRELVASYEDDYSLVPCVKALSDLVMFLKAAPMREYTSLTLTPDGDWYVEWLSEESRLSIEFADGGLARFMLHQRNPRHPSRTDVLTGSTTSDALVQTAINPLAPWMKQAA
jgi:hypothetical protein